MDSPILLWFRRDFRLDDNPALSAAVETGRPIIPVFIWSPEEEGEWAPGSASKWWLNASLTVFAGCLQSLGSRLVIRRGPNVRALSDLARESGATSVYWNRSYEPLAVSKGPGLVEELKRLGLEKRSFNGSLLYEPWEVKSGSGKPYQVFTPYWKMAQTVSTPGIPLSAPKYIRAPKSFPAGLAVEELALLPTIPWYRSFAERFEPGEAAALHSLRVFGQEVGDDYVSTRDYPAQRGTSRLSASLHFGEISPRRIWHELRECEGKGWDTYRKELGWREFAYHLLYHFPHTPSEALRPEYREFPWRSDESTLRAWQIGQTGYPIVDAGMRELWATGWMHNRVRMIVSSFLVKDLLHSWLDGARWFWDTLVDADLASNTLGWQWAGGCGADAAPFFRVFNPILQGEKFDTNGDYVRRWCPELARLPKEIIHKPFEASAFDLSLGGVVLEKNYPLPIVEHGQARLRALAAYEKFRRKVP